MASVSFTLHKMRQRLNTFVHVCSEHFGNQSCIGLPGLFAEPMSGMKTTSKGIQKIGRLRPATNGTGKTKLLQTFGIENIIIHEY
mmetsp:Transcript_5380/g.6805  ORF Transcript_5380/g.6805 Transcript_5380/m.6805 type:complete len:85 (-) Transcript_5380:1173-1427(-)